MDPFAATFLKTTYHNLSVTTLPIRHKYTTYEVVSFTTMFFQLIQGNSSRRATCTGSAASAWLCGADHPLTFFYPDMRR